MIDPKKTGPDAIFNALDRIDLDALSKEHTDIVKSGKKTKRPRSIQILNAIEGFKRNDKHPRDLVMSKVPVIPPAYRPYTTIGDSFQAGDANELYRDFLHTKEAYEESYGLMGNEGSGEALLGMYDALSGLYGYGDPVADKTKQRGVSGFMKKITGTNPKTSWVQGKMLAKTQDNVGRSVIAVDPDLKLDEIGIPYTMAWKMYAPYIQRRLKLRGMSNIDALKHVKDQTETAKKALEIEVGDRPVMYSRAPAWHKFNSLGGKPKLIDGDAIKVNPLITNGQNADFDGDTMNIHVPSTPEAVKELKEKLMPSKMLFSIRDNKRVVPSPKHEMILGLYTANKRKAKNQHTFNSEDEAMKAIQNGTVKLSDEVHITGMQ